MKMPHIFHKWSAWQYYSQKIIVPPNGFRSFPYTLTVRRRRRHCQVCNIEQFQREDLRPNRGGWPNPIWIACGSGDIHLTRRV